MSIKTTFIITAHCDKAARANNEDNCLVRAKLSQNTLQHFGDEKTFLSDSIELDKKGCLLVVADGMGGLNAGEVASKIAVEAVSNFFDTQTAGIAEKSDEELFRIIEDAIRYADENIKFDAEQNPEHSGMGTTIAILWLLNGKAYVGWCGDSRIYCYNIVTKSIQRLTHDHSLVQMLVDEGDITEKEAFNHPQSNIIMRSLGDSSGEVKPETLKEAIPLHDGDTFLLCSDGLCGVLRDKTLAGVLEKAAKMFPAEQLDKWNDLLWEEAENSGWHDNVTSVLCYVKNGIRAEKHPVSVRPVLEKMAGRKELFGLLAGLLLILAVVLVIFMNKCGRGTPSVNKPDEKPAVQLEDSLNTVEDKNDTTEGNNNGTIGEKKKLDRIGEKKGVTPQQQNEAGNEIKENSEVSSQESSSQTIMKEDSPQIINKRTGDPGKGPRR